MAKEKLSKFNKNLKTAMNIKKKEPYISINKIAEYMTAEPIRRRQIIKNLKQDIDFYKVYYSEVKNIIPKYFKSNYEISVLEEAIDKIRDKEEITDWGKNDNANSIIALENVMDSNLPDLSNCNLIKDTFNLKVVKLGGVDITIKPNLYFKNTSNKKIGAIKIHIAKTPDNQLDENNRIYASTLIKYAFIKSGFKENDIDDSLYVSYDIFKKDFSTSPKPFKRTVSAIEAACEEIALRWNTV